MRRSFGSSSRRNCAGCGRLRLCALLLCLLLLCALAWRHMATAHFSTQLRTKHAGKGMSLRMSRQCFRHQLYPSSADRMHMSCNQASKTRTAQNSRMIGLGQPTRQMADVCQQEALRRLCSSQRAWCSPSGRRVKGVSANLARIISCKAVQARLSVLHSCGLQNT